MKIYYDLNEASEFKSQRTLLLSLMLILLSLFIFLTSFTESDKKKIKIFKKNFNKSIMFSGKGNIGKESITEFGDNGDPLSNILKKMKSENINVKLTVKYLTLKNIKDMKVYKGKNGLVLVLPETIMFRKRGNSLDFTAKKYLSKILFLVKDLPYEVEIRGYSSGKGLNNDYKRILKDSANKAMAVYEFFIGNGVAPEKLFVSGYGKLTDPNRLFSDRVEILFKELR